MRVLIAREEKLCGALPKLLKSYGLDPVNVPVTAIEFIYPQPDQLWIREGQWVAFTSANGVRGLHAALENIGQTLPKSAHVAVVGKATALAVQEYFGRKVNLTASYSDGEHLAQDLLKILPTTCCVYYPCASSTESEFERMCRGGGIAVESVVVYRTLALGAEKLLAELQDAAPFGAVVFYAPSAARAFNQAWRGAWNFSAIAIGPATERALRKMGQQDVFTAKDPEAASIAEAVLQACATHSE